MFEKEAEESFKKRYPNNIAINSYYVEGFKDGYNKSNEWHKPSEKLPGECSLVLAYLFEETEPTICEYVVSNQWECLPKRIVFCSNDQIRLWKEIVPPKKFEDRILESVKLNYESYVQEEKQFHNVGVDDEFRKRQKGEQTRPFKDCDELVECWEKKMFIPAAMFTKDTRNRLYRPAIWVKNKNDYTERLITTFGNDFVKVGVKTKPVSLDVLYTDYEFLDGTPCGVNLEMD